MEICLNETFLREILEPGVSTRASVWQTYDQQKLVDKYLEKTPTIAATNPFSDAYITIASKKTSEAYLVIVFIMDTSRTRF